MLISVEALRSEVSVEVLRTTAHWTVNHPTRKECLNEI
jgi:hypothetical protein